MSILYTNVPSPFLISPLFFSLSFVGVSLLWSIIYWDKDPIKILSPFFKHSVHRWRLKIFTFFFHWKISCNEHSTPASSMDTPVRSIGCRQWSHTVDRMWKHFPCSVTKSWLKWSGWNLKVEKKQNYTHETMIDKRYGRIPNNANCLDFMPRRFTFAKHNR